MGMKLLLTSSSISPFNEILPKKLTLKPTNFDFEVWGLGLNVDREGKFVPHERHKQHDDR